MLRDTLVGLIEPMQISAGVDPLALTIRKQASDDRPSCLENPRPERAESSLTEDATSPFQAEPAQPHQTIVQKTLHKHKHSRVSGGTEKSVCRRPSNPICSELEKLCAALPSAGVSLRHRDSGHARGCKAQDCSFHEGP